MPVSANGKQYFTSEQLEYARCEASTLEYVKAQGYQLQQKGKYHCLKEHDSFIFTPNGRWFWNSHGMHGDAIDFITQFEHKSLVEAVLILNGENTQDKAFETYRRKEITRSDATKSNLTQDKSNEFVLPRQASNFSKLFAYLTKKRKIDSEIVQQAVRDKKIYLSAVPTKSGREINNVVFVGYNNEGKAVNAYNRGTWAAEGQKEFKGDVSGSDKNWAFTMEGTDSTTVIVFEGAIDAMSHATLSVAECGREIGLKPHRISLGGLFINPLYNFLDTHPEVTYVCFAFDNDHEAKHNHGREAAQKFTERLIAERGFKAENIVEIVPPLGKDWNEYLVLKTGAVMSNDEENQIE